MSDVAAIIEREISLVSRFIELLLDEQNCLKQAAPELLLQIASEKGPLIGALNQLEAERNLAVGNTTGLSKQAVMDAWLAKNPKNLNATVHWEKLLKMAREAKALHELNTQLIKLHLTKTNAALSILNSNTESRALYDSGGHAALHTGSRIVDSA
jgi:flagella synthesis protein FlgN